MQTSFSPEQLRDPATARSNKILADLRALRLLHRDLPDLSGAGRRARQPARAHLPDQGHAGRGAAGGREDGQAHRPLPLLPRLHDDLPVGGATTCTSSTTPAPTSRRPTAGRRWSGRCAGRWRRCCPIRGGSGWRSGRRASGGRSRGCCRARSAPCWSSRPAPCRRRAGWTSRRSSRRKGRGASGWRCSPAARSGRSTPTSTRRRSGS